MPGSVLSLCRHYLTALSQPPILEEPLLSFLLYRQRDSPIPSSPLLKICFTCYLAFSVLHAPTIQIEATSSICLAVGNLAQVHPHWPCFMSCGFQFSVDRERLSLGLISSLQEESWPPLALVVSNWHAPNPISNCLQTTVNSQWVGTALEVGLQRRQRKQHRRLIKSYKS